MTGVEIEYFLGLYFIISSLAYTSGRFSAEALRLIIGIVLVVLAVIGYSPIR